MLNNPTLDKLRALKLTGMANAFAEQLQKPLSDLDFSEKLAILVEQEWLLRENRKLKRRITQAKLQQPACIEDIDYQHQRGFTKAKILELVHDALNDHYAYRYATTARYSKESLELLLYDKDPRILALKEFGLIKD